MHHGETSTSVQRAFTLIELLVVIAIIGVLSSVVLSAVNSARTKAQASKMAQEFRQIEKGLLAYAIEQGTTRWWDDSLPTENPTISAFVGQSGFVGGYLPGSYVSPVGSGYYYDNDGDTYTCGGSGDAGVGLFISSVPANIMTELDRIFDASDGLTCGRIVSTGGGTTLMFKLDYDQTI